MKIKIILLLTGFLLTMTSLLTACSDDAEQPAPKTEATGDHVWKTQTDALKSAKDMAKKMQENLKLQQENLDESN